MEEKLTTLLRQRDKGTIENFYDKYAPAIYGIIKTDTTSTADSDTILHDSFVRFFNILNTGKGINERLFICLYKIAKETIKEKKAATLIK